ncbi:MAG: hypothetical protein COT91_02825 [Candidatus Doudnabacteria bacterium CG10_big_fil_rev_8_21_14_0_10_41_10]|uniref:Baseplate protein J-like domain-containing protein n=1 Tax=Candidatus Doudnabacteria bacterium CG10_big_fil_rev_8_21_14_0_10_41_10 TaxID=1974551 RepID=A0A2H0VDH5_9BACT|nr:MAG: hypothetical protein COT91_02825 [Candidatus Doudnabacteria bacterium CG10_big_fil_rev_8_21_14_0_10_41_10]
MAKAIFLDYSEEVVAVLQKIKRAGEDEVILTVPKGARVFRSLTGLKLLLNQSSKLGKKISIATADDRGRVLVKRAGISLSMEVPSGLAVTPVGTKNARRRMGDIVKRPPKKEEPPPPVPEPPDHQEEKELSDLIGPNEEATEIKIPKPVKIPLGSYKYPIITTGVVIAALAILIFYVLPVATVAVTARLEPISRDLEILVDSQATVSNLQNLSVPGRRFSEELSFTDNYQTTGIKKVGEKASGFVTLYNFSNNNLILRSNTTRLEVNGKSYNFLQDLGRVNPTRLLPNGEVDPSSLNDPFPIVADGPGTDFNLSEGTRFEVINEVFGYQPEILYAVNANPVSGGSDKEIKVLSEEDISAARASTTRALIKKLEVDLQNKISKNTRLTETASSVEVLEEFVNFEVGAETDSFELSQRVMVNALLYNESEVKDLMVERVIRQLPENKILLETIELTTEFVSLDLSAGAGTLRAHLDSAVQYQIDSDFLKRGLPGKTENEVKEILLSRPEIQGVEVGLSPFWVKKVPRFESKIDFKVVE